MITIKSSIGNIKLNQFSQKHARNNNHSNPLRNQPVLNALSRNQFKVMEKLPSGWRGHKTFNLVLLIKTAVNTILVILKEIAEKEYLFITSYIPRPKQLQRYAH